MGINSESFSKHRSSGRFEKDIARVLQQVLDQNWDEVETELRLIAKKEKPRILLSEFMAPLMQDLGHLAAADIVSVAQLRVLSSLVKEPLYVIRDSARQPHLSSRFVLATPEGDFHELGILIAHTIIAHAGFKSLYLGPNTPMKEFCEAARRFGVSHVILGSTLSHTEGAKDDLVTYLQFLNENLAKDIAVWIGGRNANSALGKTSREVTFFSSIQEFENVLGLLD